MKNSPNRRDLSPREHPVFLWGWNSLGVSRANGGTAKASDDWSHGRADEFRRSRARDPKESLFAGHGWNKLLNSRKNQLLSQAGWPARDIAPLPCFSVYHPISLPVVMSVTARLRISTLYEVLKSDLLRRKTTTRRPLLKKATLAMIPIDTRKAMCGSLRASWYTSGPTVELFTILSFPTRRTGQKWIRAVWQQLNHKSRKIN